MKKIDTEITHITPASRNIFLDLGFSEDEAKILLEEAEWEEALEKSRKTVKKIHSEPV